MAIAAPADGVLALVQLVCAPDATALQRTGAAQRLLPHTGALPPSQLCHVVLAVSASSAIAPQHHTATLQLLHQCAARLLDTLAHDTTTAPPHDAAMRAAVALHAAASVTTLYKHDTLALCADAVAHCAAHAPHMSLFAVAVAYGGVAAMHRAHVALPVAHDDDGDDGGVHSVDVLCRELERAVQQRCAALPVTASRDEDESVTQARSVCDVVAALADVGVYEADTLAALAEAVQRLRRVLTVQQVVAALVHAARIDRRVDDVVAHHEDVSATRAMTTQRDVLVRTLGGWLAQRRRVTEQQLRRDVHLVVQLRRAYAASATLYACAPALWDVLRAMHVPHHVVQRPHGSLRERIGGKLFQHKRYAVRRVTDDAAQRVPPQLRQHRALPRAHAPRAVRRVAFGRRKIPRDMSTRLQRKRCRSMLTRRDARRRSSGVADDAAHARRLARGRLAPLPPLQHSNDATVHEHAQQTAIAVSPSPRVPLSLQLEAYIRKEHRLYAATTTPTHAQTLPIFREVLGVMADRFPEYGAVLHAVRDAYEGALREATYASSGGGRRRHAARRHDEDGHSAAVARVQEKANATISNLQAQLHAAQALAHLLREQLAAAEHAHRSQQLELDAARRECAASEERVRLLSRAMIDEGARTAQYVDEARQLAREVAILRGSNALLRSDNKELMRAHASPVSDSDGTPRASLDAMASSAHARGDITSRKGHTTTCAYDDVYVHALLARLDAYDAARVVLAAPHICTIACTAATTEQGSETRRVSARDVRALAAWLRDEGVCEDDVVATTQTLLPPGLCASEELAFLRACAPVRNRQLRLAEVLRLIDLFWTWCEAPPQATSAAVDAVATTTDMHTRMLAWLRAQSGGDEATARELGVNLLVACQLHMRHPECRALLAVLRGFLPRELVLTWRRALRDVAARCAADEVVPSPDAVTATAPPLCAHTTTATTTTTTQTKRAGSAHAPCVPIAAVLRHVRHVFPEKSRAHMLQLRCCLYRVAQHCDHKDNDKAHDNNMGARAVPLARLFDAGAYFAVLLKQQLLREVEAHTLAVVERVRRVADVHKGVVSVRHVHGVLRELEPHMSDDARLRLVALCCQRSLLDARRDDDDSVTVRLDALLARLRCSVLLRRVTPPDDDDDDEGNADT